MWSAVEEQPNEEDEGSDVVKSDCLLVFIEPSVLITVRPHCKLESHYSQI